MVVIKSIQAHEILDSKERATIAISIATEDGISEAAVPSGLSTGKYEAFELRDADGGVGQAIKNIKGVIAPVLLKTTVNSQKQVDDILLQLDGTKNKSRLGANAILAVSIAMSRALAAGEKLPLYKYLSQLAENPSPLILSKPSFNMIEGGKHVSAGTLAFQEFMVVPQNENFAENLDIGKRIYETLQIILQKHLGQTPSSLSAEGAYAVSLKTVREALDMLCEAIEKSGKQNITEIAIDAAASEFYNHDTYQIDQQEIQKNELLAIYENLIHNYPILSIEDPFSQEDFDGFAELKNKIGERVLIFGDDLTVSNIDRIKQAYEKHACSGLILKPNQIGTISETLEAAKLAKSFGWKIMVANRAGETNDDFIADLAVGIGAEFIKSGAPFPAERMVKYNRLVNIEQEKNK